MWEPTAHPMPCLAPLDTPVFHRITTQGEIIFRISDRSRRSTRETEHAESGAVSSLLLTAPGGKTFWPRLKLRQDRTRGIQAGSPVPYTVRPNGSVVMRRYGAFCQRVSQRRACSLRNIIRGNEHKFITSMTLSSPSAADRSRLPYPILFQSARLHRP